MKIMADLTPRTVWAVSETAERLGMTNNEYLEHRLAGLRRQSVPERVKEMHARGFCDADVAAELGYMVGRVAEIRRDLGLPANRRFAKGNNNA